MIGASSASAKCEVTENRESVESTLSKSPNKERNEVADQPSGHLERRKSFPSISNRPVASSWVDEPFPFMPLVASNKSHKHRSEDIVMRIGKQPFRSQGRLRRPLSVPDVLFEEECEMESENLCAYPLRRHSPPTNQPIAKRHSINITTSRLPSITE